MPLANEALLAALDAGALVLDKGGRVVFADARALASLRAAREDVFDHPVHEILCPLERLTEHPRVRHVRRFDGPDGPGWIVRLGEEDDVEAERERLMRLASVSELLPIVLHELKNPLAAVQTALELALEESTTPDLAQTLHAILQEIRRAARSLLGMGAVGRDLRASTHQAVDLAIQETVDVLRPTAFDARLVVECDVRAMPLLPLDVGVVRAIVFNLVKNAIDACSPGDTVSVRAEFVAPELMLEVRDTGPGMSQDVVARCTALFYSTKSNGSGIGLPLCVRAVERAGGTLAIETAVGAGTSVRLHVPVTGG